MNDVHSNVMTVTSRRPRSKLSSSESGRVVGARGGRNRSLKKSPAVQDDDPSHGLTPCEPRRASSFDVAKAGSTTILPSNRSFDAGSANRTSAFSPVEVPRLLVQSPLSPLQLEQPRPTDNRLLTVPSPCDFRKSPERAAFSSERPPATDMFGLSTLSSITPTLLTQLSAAMAARPMTMTTTASTYVEDIKQQQSTIPKLEQMDCSGSFETVGSGSFDLPMTSTTSSFETQNHHNGGQATPEMMAQMPPKSIIQDDIRNSSGRFTLVRKRGRSEVWNLFGQVMDTVTQLRLPYVACYACKVLYTDTGGGTGNMTRHRCPLGESYRSHASSTETVEASGTNSFDSSNASNNRHVPATVASESTSTSAAALVNQHSGEALLGDVDRELLTDAIVKCCALDLIDPVVFSGRGFRALLRKLCGGASKRFDAFPDNNSIRSALQTHLRFCTDDLKNELSRTTQGVRLSVESLEYRGKEFRVIHGSRISPDWKWRSNVLGVFKAAKGNESLQDMINIVVHNYELDKNMLRVTLPTNEHNLTNMKTFVDVREKLKQILIEVLRNSVIPVMPMLESVCQITKALYDQDIRLPFEYTEANDIFAIHQLLTEWNDQEAQIEQIINSKCPQLQSAFGSLNSSHLRDIEAFIVPFKETIDSLTEEQPNMHKVLPEWFALMHECQVGDEPSPMMSDLKSKATELLKIEKESIITIEHRIAAILNPRLIRRLAMILTDTERNQACEKIRNVCGIRNPKEPLSRGSSCDGEPHRKRRLFLSSLEEEPFGDELEFYLRSQYPPQQTKDVMEFWSTTGQTQFPTLASLARRTLSIPATAPVTIFERRCSSIPPDQLNTFLMLRSMFDTENQDNE